MSCTQDLDDRVPSRRTDRLPVATLVLVGQLVGGFLLPISVANGAYAADEEWARANLNSVLWVQTSEEYYALAVSVYIQARRMLDDGLADETWTALPEQEPRDQGALNALKQRPPAVILDVDETVLDNAPFQAWLVKENKSYAPILWNGWVVDKKATAVPGAVEFVDYARQRGVAVFYVTNRRFTGDVDANGNGTIEPDEKDRELQKYTTDNLRQVGLLPQEGLSDDESVLMRGEEPEWGSDKTTRRNHIADRYRIVLLVGDSLGDFVGYGNDGDRVDFYRALAPDGRRKELGKHEQRWGKTWIVLPNPIYGSWEAAPYDFKYELPPSDKGQRKLDALEVWKE